MLGIKRSFCLHHFITEGNGHLYVSTERNRRNQTGPNLLGGEAGTRQEIHSQDPENYP